MYKTQKLADILVKMQRIEKEPKDRELDHCAADDLLCEALNVLGQNELVKSFENLHKWYA